MKDRKYDKRHVWSKNHSGCLETLCHVRGPLRNKMATLGVCSDIDPSADSVPDQTMLPTVSLTKSDIPRALTYLLERNEMKKGEGEGGGTPPSLCKSVKLVSLSQKYVPRHRVQAGAFPNLSFLNCTKHTI